MMMCGCIEIETLSQHSTHALMNGPKKADLFFFYLLLFFFFFSNKQQFERFGFMGIVGHHIRSIYFNQFDKLIDPIFKR